VSEAFGRAIFARNDGPLLSPEDREALGKLIVHARKELRALIQKDDLLFSLSWLSREGRPLDDSTPLHISPAFRNLLVSSPDPEVRETYARVVKFYSTDLVEALQRFMSSVQAGCDEVEDALAEGLPIYAVTAFEARKCIEACTERCADLDRAIAVFQRLRAACGLPLTVEPRRRPKPKLPWQKALQEGDRFIPEIFRGPPTPSEQALETPQRDAPPGERAVDERLKSLRARMRERLREERKKTKDD
jgi:hypothetical protein